MPGGGGHKAWGHSPRISVPYNTRHSTACWDLVLVCILHSLESTSHTPNHTAGSFTLPELGHSSQSKLRRALRLCVAPMRRTYALHHIQYMPMLQDVSWLHLLVRIKLKPYHYHMRMLCMQRKLPCHFGVTATLLARKH